MGDVHNKIKLRLVREVESSVVQAEANAKAESSDEQTVAVKPKMKSAMASQLSSFADELDKQIAQILAS